MLWPKKGYVTLNIQEMNSKNLVTPGHSWDCNVTEATKRCADPQFWVQIGTAVLSLHPELCLQMSLPTSSWTLTQGNSWTYSFSDSQRFMRRGNSQREYLGFWAGPQFCLWNFCLCSATWWHIIPLTKRLGVQTQLVMCGFRAREMASSWEYSMPLRSVQVPMFSSKHSYYL